MSNSAVSVLIPCHNGEAYLAETLESVRRQTLPPAEIIVVDDASTDRSREIAASFGSNVTILDNVGRGASAARNRASEAATGEFLQYLDADDLLEPNALASRVKALERTGGDVAISDWQRLEPVDGAWRPGKIESGRLPDPVVQADLLVFQGFWAPPAAILYRRSVYERIGRWPANLPVIQDARFLFDAARVSRRFVHVPGVGARYRQHREGSLSSQDPARFWRDVLANTQEIEQLWRSEGQLDDVHRDALADTYALCARVGFSLDQSLFDAGRSAMKRFAGRAPSRFLRAALLLTQLVGYQRAKVVLGAVVSISQPPTVR